MTQPNWSCAKTVEVAAKPPFGFWTLAIDYVPGPRLLRFRVIGKKDEKSASVSIEWTVISDLKEPSRCGANGMGLGDGRSAFLSPAAPVGALIGKLGGSPVDIPDATANAPAFGTKRIFAIGEHCVIAVAATDSGPLYLTMNDELRNFSKHDGSLLVQIDEATA